MRYNRYPDEKGTESILDSGNTAHECCYNRYPDEKGTERASKHRPKALLMVTTVTPMKRGLKVSGHQLIYRGRRRYNRYPDEKGTES